MQDSQWEWLYLEHLPEIELRMVTEYLANSSTYQQFKVFPAQRLLKIWEESSHGIFRDSKGLHLLADLFLENTLRLMINTTLSGHTEVDGKSYAQDLMSMELTEDEFENLQSWFIDSEAGHWNISDYGLNALLAKCVEIRQAQMEGNSAALLMYLDMGLNIIHQRFDLASLFIEDGQKTLSRLAASS